MLPLKPPFSKKENDCNAKYYEVDLEEHLTQLHGRQRKESDRNVNMHRKAKEIALNSY